MRALLALLTFVLALSSGVRAEPAQDAALAMVRSLQLGTNLSNMAYRMAPLAQTTWGAVLQAVGPAKADELLRAEIAVVVPKYQQEWDTNLAKAWSPLMTAEEFLSIARLKQASPFLQKYASLQGQAGASMRAASEPLLEKVLGEVLNGVFAKSQQAK